MSVKVKKRSTILGAVSVGLALVSGAWVWHSTAHAQFAEGLGLGPVMECPVVAAGVVAELNRAGFHNEIVGQVAIGTASGGGINAHFGAIPCIVQNCPGPTLVRVCPDIADAGIFKKNI